MKRATDFRNLSARGPELSYLEREDCAIAKWGRVGDVKIESIEEHDRLGLSFVIGFNN